MIALLWFFLTLLASPFKSKSRLEAENAALRHERSRPAHEWGSLVLGHAVSMVSIDPQGHHDHPARDPCALAPGRLPAILAAEIPLVCTENSDSNVLVMHAADEGMRYDASGALNRARDRRILV